MTEQEESTISERVTSSDVGEQTLTSADMEEAEEAEEAPVEEAPAPKKKKEETEEK